MFKKIILIILSLGIVIYLGFLVVNNNNQIVKKGNEIPILEPTEIPKTPVKSPTNNVIEFNKAITLELNDKIIFPDGLKVVLTEINDSRCKPNAQCFWQGEVSVVLEASAGKLSEPGEVYLGTELTKTANPENYIFTLQSADEKSATIFVEYKKP
jgi:hypothetical protein